MCTFASRDDRDRTAADTSVVVLNLARYLSPRALGTRRMGSTSGIEQYEEHDGGPRVVVWFVFVSRWSQPPNPLTSDLQGCRSGPPIYVRPQMFGRLDCGPAD
jgi:hypothetical protein